MGYIWINESQSADLHKSRLISISPLDLALDDNYCTVIQHETSLYLYLDLSSDYNFIVVALLQPSLESKLIYKVDDCKK